MRWAAVLLLLAWVGIAPAQAQWPYWGQPEVAPERRLVRLRPQGLGYVAEVSPDFDYTVYLSREYHVGGVDPGVLAALATSDGLPVRLLGRFQADRVQVEPVRAGGEPPVLPIPATGRSWRGRCLVRATDSGPELRLGDAWVSVTAPQLPLSGGQTQEFEATVFEAGEVRTVVDAVARPTLEDPLVVGPVRLWGQLSEPFLSRVAEAYLKSHPMTWNDPSGTAEFGLTQLGVTLLGCPAGQLRLYGRLQGRLKVAGQTIPLLVADFEGLARPTFVANALHLPLVSDSLRVRVLKPLFLQLPESWSRGLSNLLTTHLASGATLPVPAAYRSDLLRMGLLEEDPRRPSQDGNTLGFGVWTRPTGDRRTGQLCLAAPVDEGRAGPDLATPRWQSGPNFCLAFSEDAVNANLAGTVPTLLPIHQPIPANLQGNQSVLIFRLRFREAIVTAIKVTYSQGRFRVSDGEVSVAWQVGPLSGVEPAARFSGSARISGQGTPLVLQVEPELSSLQFLSPHLLEQPPEQQAALKQQVMKAVAEARLQVPLPLRREVPQLGSGAALVLNRLVNDSGALVLQGTLEP